MDIDGDIKVWTDGEKVCARLHADGPEGPIVVQASAPLGPIRRRVARALVRRGVTIAGDEPSFKATVARVARRKALKRLKAMAPAAFAKGGLATYVARRELQKRRRQRIALARKGRPVGVKAIGPVPTAPVLAKPPVRRKRIHRRRKRGFARWRRPMSPLRSLPTRAALAPIMSPPPPPPRPVSPAL